MIFVVIGLVVFTGIIEVPLISVTTGMGVLLSTDHVVFRKECMYTTDNRPSSSCALSTSISMPLVKLAKV